MTEFIPPKVGDIGFEHFSTNYGPSYSENFTVVEVKGKKMKIIFGPPFYKIVEYSWRRNNRWVPVGKTSKDYRGTSIIMGRHKPSNNFDKEFGMY